VALIIFFFGPVAVIFFSVLGALDPYFRRFFPPKIDTPYLFYTCAPPPGSEAPKILVLMKIFSII